MHWINHKSVDKIVFTEKNFAVRMHLVKSSGIQPLSNSAYIVLYIKQSEILGEIRKIIWIFFILVCN